MEPYQPQHLRQGWRATHMGPCHDDLGRYKAASISLSYPGIQHSCLLTSVSLSCRAACEPSRGWGNYLWFH